VYGSDKQLQSTAAPLCLVVVRSRTSWPGSAYGNGRRSIAQTRVKIAVVAPIPSASVSTTTMVNPGCLRKVRTSYLTSCQNALMCTFMCVGRTECVRRVTRLKRMESFFLLTPASAVRLRARGAHRHGRSESADGSTAQPLQCRQGHPPQRRRHTRR